MVKRLRRLRRRESRANGGLVIAPSGFMGASGHFAGIGRRDYSHERQSRTGAAESNGVLAARLTLGWSRKLENHRLFVKRVAANPTHPQFPPPGRWGGDGLARQKRIPYDALGGLRGLPLGHPPFLAFLAMAASLAGLLDLPPILPSCEYHSRTAGGGVSFGFMVSFGLPAPS